VEPGVFWAVGTAALIVATAFAFRRADAPLALQLLLGGAAVICAHAPPLALRLGHARFFSQEQA
jgi:hypothetical protein